jgi:formylglycine-generating enzyme required for sulfatase activity
LLTEAEYEYAAHGGTQWVYPWGDELGDKRAHCKECGTEATYGDRSAPVGSFEANGFGLYDMVGNVWQMVQDCYGKYSSGDVATAIKTDNCSTRILRGGSFDDGTENLRITLRLATYTGGRSSGIGFRVVRTLPTPDGP